MRNKTTIIDSHVHVGWYTDGYHKPAEVLADCQAAGISEIVVSSTSTCAELYKLVIREMKELKRIGGDRVHPLLWLTPRMMKSWGIRKMLHSKIKWEGVKMHFKAHHEWFYNTRLLQQALALVEKMELPLLLHTGLFKECHAAAFEPIIASHPNLPVVLAHGRPVDETITLMKKYDNVWTDTAFMPIDDIKAFVDAGLADRMQFGSDSPINLVYFKEYDTAGYISNFISGVKSAINIDNFTLISQRSVFKRANN